MFTDAKRPITKKLLQHIDLIALLRQLDKDALLANLQVVAMQSSSDHQIPADLSLEQLESLLLNGSWQRSSVL